MDDPETGSQGARDAALVLPFVALFLILPPIIHIFAAPVRLAGIPLIVVYLFAWWAGGVIAAFLIARRLAPREGSGESDERGRR